MISDKLDGMKKLPEFTSLLREVIKIYKKNTKELVLFSIISFVAAPLIAVTFAIPLVAGVVAQASPIVYAILVPLLLVGIVAVIYVQTWIQVSLIRFIDKPGSMKEIFKKSRLTVVSFWITGTFSSLVILLGFLLFIIPGIIFGVWFSLISFIVVLERTYGFEALIKSREYVRGNLLKVIFYLIGFQIISALVLYIPSFVLNSLSLESVSRVYTLVMQALLIPATVIFMYEIYKSLKKDISDKVKSANKKIYKIGASLGIILPIIIVILVILFFSQLGSSYNLTVPEGTDIPSLDSFTQNLEKGSQN